MIRFADDAVMAFEEEEDARKVLVVLRKRFEKFGLRLHPEKTRIVPFRRPPRRQRGGKGPATFDFLGFTHYWARTRRGAWRPAMKTLRTRLRRAIRSIARWCLRHRHDPVKEQCKMLCKKIKGHFNYYGVTATLGASSNSSVRSSARLAKGAAPA